LIRGNSRAAALSIALVALALAAFATGDGRTGSAANGGLLNPGFEQGLTNWTATAADAALVVSSEGAAQCPTYAGMGGVVVEPFKGTKALRLGACKQINQAQTKGTNKASQSFVADGSLLRFAFRLFSWEHRNSDEFLVELKRGNQNVGTLASPVVVPMAGAPGGQRTCSGLPCRLSVDAGKAGDFIATDWITATVNIPQSLIGQTLTLTYGVSGTKDTAHATWGYFDNVNTPPVSRFEQEIVDLREGDLVQFSDSSFDPDGDEIVNWQWEIDGEVINEQNPIFIFPDEGTYSACLTVTDSFGDTNRVCSGGTATDGTAVAPLTLDNQAPLVNALNVETLAGQPVALFGRTLEPGWEDELSAGWEVDGEPVTATLTDDKLPFLSTGVVTGQAISNLNVQGTLTVADFDGGIGSDTFDVTIVPNDNQRHEPNGSLASAPTLVTDTAHLSWIQTVGDQDFFEARLADGSLLPAGGQLLVTLKGPDGAGLNADYDLVILAELPDGVGGFRSGDAGQTNISTAGFRSGGFRSGGFRSGGFRSGGFRSGGFRSGGFRSGGFRSGSMLYPLSQVGFNGLEGENVAAADITLDELGLGEVEGVSVAAYSGSKGTDQEVALAQSDVNGTKFYIAVVGANGAFSGSQPYTLQIETAVPEDPVLAFGPEVCNKAPLVGSDLANPPTSTTLDLNPGFPALGSGKTLIVTQRERIIAVTDDPSTPENEGIDAWNALLPKLQALAQHPAVSADIISVPSTFFDNWDSNPCDVAEANAVTASIRGQIQARLAADPGIQYVVLAGGGDIIPQRRVPDETIIGNEAGYAFDALLNPSSPLFWSLMGGFVLTDDYYVDDQPSPWQGRELYVPDRAIGRIVETPLEIGAAADAFLASDGLLDYSTAQDATALVTGYDFFDDGAEVTANNLAAKLDVSTLISDTWTANDLRCLMLGEGTCDVPSVIAANAHWLHYALLSANGFETNNFDDILNSNETATAGGTTPALDGRIVFTMGCHGGLSVPDREAQDPDAGLGIDPSLDFVQAMARQRAVFIASTGYGLGDDQGLGGTELLLTHFADELVKGDAIIGDALNSAKETFLLSLASMTAYDEKSSIQLAMYGLPMYQVLVPEGPGSVTTLQEQQSDGEEFSLTVIDGATATTTTHSIEEVATDNGSYFTADGDAQATAFRAIEPRVVIPIPPGDDPVQGVLIKSGTYADTAGFDPVIARPTQEWLLDDHEPNTCLDAYWPSVPATVNSIDPGGAQALVVTPGQFRCDSGSAPTVTGTQRSYSSLTVELLRSAPGDVAPPTVHEVGLATGENGSVDVTVSTSDSGGIASIVLLKYSGGAITPVEFTPAGVPLTGSFTINVPDTLPGDDIAGQIVDVSGNVAYFTGKGSIGFTFLGVTLTPDPVYATPGVPVTFQVSVPTFSELLEPFYTIDFGDGLFGSGPVTGTTFTVTHTYGEGTQFPTTATIKVMDKDGQLGTDKVTVRRLCDPLGDAGSAAFDLVSCDVTTTATTMTIAIRVAGEILSTGQYRVNIQTASKNAQLKVDNGRATGPLKSLVVTQSDPGELRFTFDLAEVGLVSGGELQWSADSQTVGFADRMPDSGVFTFVVP
jgi:PKD repeat protein